MRSFFGVVLLSAVLDCTIRLDRVDLPDDWDERVKDLIRRMLLKDPQERITIPEIRVRLFAISRLKYRCLGTDMFLTHSETCLVDRGWPGSYAYY
jgi:serine/threonine protein kinase